MQKSRILKFPKLSKWMELSISVLIPILLILTVNRKIGIFFETNDDRYIMSLLSGVMTEKPDTHPFFLNYFLWLPLQGLYRITDSIPWYGIFLIGCWLLSLISILYCAITKCNHLISQFIVIILTGATFLSIIYALGLIQFTSVAALLAVSGYTCLIIDCKSKKNGIFFCVLELLACFVRLESMLMIQPLGISTLAFIFLFEQYREIPTMRKIKVDCFIRKFIKPFSMLGCIFVISLTGFLISSHTDEWKDFKSFSAARSLLFDYCEKSPYEEIAPILNKYGVSEAKYEAFWMGVIMDWDDLTDCIVELAEHEDAGRECISVKTALRNAWNESIVHVFWNIHYIIWTVWVLLLAGIIYNKYWYLFIPAGLFAVARMSIWTYLHYNGRLPMRVAISMFMAEIVLVLALSLRLWIRDDLRLHEKAVFILLLAVFINRTFLTGQSEYRYVAEQNRSQREYIQSMWEVMNYCNERESECFLLEPISFSYYKGSALDVSLSQPFNALYAGGWFYPAPNVQTQLENKMNAYDGFSVIIYNGFDWENTPIKMYLEENTGVSGLLIDNVTVSFGGSYNVYKFERNFVFE